MGEGSPKGRSDILHSGCLFRRHRNRKYFVCALFSIPVGLAVVVVALSVVVVVVVATLVRVLVSSDFLRTNCGR